MLDVIPVFIKRPTVQCITGMKKSQLYDLGRKGLAPRPIKLSTRSSAWVASEINEWVELLKQGKTWADRGEAK